MGKAISAASVSCSVKLASLGFSCAHAHPPQIETSIGGESRIGGGAGKKALTGPALALSGPDGSAIWWM